MLVLILAFITSVPIRADGRRPLGTGANCRVGSCSGSNPSLSNQRRQYGHTSKRAFGCARWRHAFRALTRRSYIGPHRFPPPVLIPRSTDFDIAFGNRSTSNYSDEFSQFYGCSQFRPRPQSQGLYADCGALGQRRARRIRPNGEWEGKRAIIDAGRWHLSRPRSPTRERSFQKRNAGNR